MRARLRLVMSVAVAWSLTAAPERTTAGVLLESLRSPAELPDRSAKRASL